MKILKSLFVAMLVVVMAFSMVACGGNGGEAGGTAQPTVKPTPVSMAVKLTQEQMNNYYVEFDIVEKGAMEQDKDGNYVEVEKTTSIVELGLDGIILRSVNGGQTFGLDASGNISMLSVEDISKDKKAFFSAHKKYFQNPEDLENKGTETVCGMETTHYFYKNGLFNIHMWVNEELDMTVKFEDEGYYKFKAEIKKIEFGAINTPGYMFDDFKAKIPTPKPEQ